MASDYRIVVGGKAADTAETFTSALIAMLVGVVLIVGFWSQCSTASAGH